MKTVTFTNKDPAWLNNLKSDSAKRFEELSFHPTFFDSPTEKRYTDLDKIELKKDFGEFSIKYPNVEGIVITSLKDAIEKHPVIVEKYLFKLLTKNKHAAMHISLVSNGIFVYIPKNVKTEENIVCEIKSNKNNGNLFFHTLIVAEENSKITFLEIKESNETDSFHSDGTEIFVNDNACVNIIKLQNWSKKSNNLSICNNIVKKNGKLTYLELCLGSNITKSQNETKLLGDNATVNTKGLFLTTQKQHKDITTNSIHDFPNTNSKTEYKFVSKDNSESIFRGLIQVDQKATNSDSDLTGNILVIGDNAKANAIPSLKINTNAVKVKHSATVSRIDEEELFYLKSRGLNQKQAEELIIHGYFAPLYEYVDLEKNNKHLQDIINESVKTC